MSANTITLEQDIVVTHLTQPVYLVGEDGSLRQLAEGDAVAKGAQLLSPEGGTLGAGTLQISLPVADLHPDELDPAGDGVLLALNQGEGEPSATGAVSDDIAALQAAILDGVDPTKAFEASAAGGAPAAGGGVAGGSGNGGFIVVDRSADSTLAQGGFDTDEPASAIVRREDLPAAADELLLDATAPQISVSAPDNIKDATPTLTGITDAAPGSTVTLVVTDANGNQQILIATVNPDGSFSVDVATPLADGDYRVTASVTDPAGNTGTAADDGSVDSTAPSVTVTAPDNTNDSTPTITGTTNAAPGSTVTLVVTDANGNQQTLMATVQPDGTYSSNVVTPLPDGGYKVTASVTDPAGNTGTAADDGSVDTTANITVSLDDVNGDNVGNAPITGTSDVGPGRTVTLVITDANGDKVTVTAVIDGNGNYSTTADLSGLADGNLTVVASATDAAGNRADARDDTTSLDTTAPDARITLDADITPDDIINAAEANQNIAITGTVGGDVRVGDTVILTVNGKTFTGLVLADKTFNIKVPGADLVADGDKLIDARVTTTDAAGNSTTATGSEGYSVDTQGPSVLVDIVDTQLTVGETSDVTFTFSEQVTGFDPSDLTVVGGTVTGLTTSDGGKTWSGTFTPDANFEGTASVTVKPESYTDLAGNQGSGGSDSAAIDTQATGAPTVVITEDIDNDGTIDRTEISGKVDVNVSLPTDAKAGDTLKVSGQADRVLTDTDISAGKVGYEFDRPADGVKLTVTATIVDAAGNVSAEGKDSAVMGDTTATGAPTVVITEDANNDGTISNSEISGPVNVEVSLPAEAKAGDTLKVSGQADRVLSDADISAGKVGYEFDRPADGAGLTVTATLVDAAGNVSAEGKDSAVMGDTTATGAPTVVITEDADNDGTIDRTEISGKVDVNVGLPTEAKAGDTLKVSGQADRVLSDTDITAGKVGYEFDRPADGQKITITATLVDAAGNVSAEGRDSATMGDTTATGAPTVVITEDTNNDGTISNSEINGAINVEVGLPTDAKAGDTLKVSGQADRVLSDADITAGKVAYEFDRPADGVKLIVTATLVDGAGNESLPGSDSATMGDTTATGAPTVVITEDADNDGTIDRTEISGKVDVNVGLPTEAKAGDTLKVSGQADRVLSDTDISAGKVGYEFDRPADGQKITVTASIVDGAGNVSAEGKDSAVMGDTTATGAPTVVITEDTDNDGTIDRTEISGKVDVNVGLPADAKAGDTLKVSGQADRVLSDADISAGKVAYEFDRPADGVTLTVTATLVDAAGNVSAEGSDSAVMGDTTATGAPTVVITEDANNDGTISNSEISGKVNVEVGLPAEAKAGDTLKVSGQADRVLSDADITAGKVGYEFDRPADGAGLTVTATLVDGAGNVSLPGSDSATMGDTTATGAPTVVITEDTNNDGTIDRTEINGKVNVEVGLPTDAKAGDTLKVSGQADRVLSDTDISAGKVAYEFDRPADGVKLTVTASIVDAAGNVSAEGKDSAVMGDTTATGAPTVVITEDTDNDGTIDRTEINGHVNVEVGLPAEAKAGDTLKVSGQADRVLSDADITAGKVVYEFDRPADGVKLTVTATIVDAAGNVSAEGKDSAVMGDTTATGAPTVVITEDTNNDGTISNTEIRGKVNVEVGLPAEAKAGDTLKVSVQADRVLTDADISAGKVGYEFDRPADGQKITVTATLVDAAGNVSAEGSDSAVMGDTTATGAPTVVITEDGNNDGTISNSEISGKVDVNVGLPAEAKAGDTLKVSGQADRVLSDADISAGKVGYEFDRPADGVKLTVTASIVDAAGNVSAEGKDSATMGDTTATGAPTVVITEDANNDGTISNSEINGAINVEVGLPAEAKAGDTLKVSGQADRVLTDADITAGKVAYEFDRPADGVTLTVTASIVDGAGNESLPGSDSATMGDTTATGAPTVVITEDADNDGTIDRTEINGKVNVEVGLPTDAKAGDTLKVSGQADRVLSDADISASKVAYEFDRPADGQKITVTATIVDGAGNVSAEGKDSATMGDTTATGAPTVVITEDTDNDGTISNSEINGAINVEVSLPAEAKAGDTLKVSGQADRVLSDTDITAGKVGYEFDRPADGVTLTVTATIVDAAGNVSAEGRDSAVMGDTTATGAPTVTITEDTDNDGTISNSEINGAINVEVGLPAEAKAGDTLKVSGQADRVLSDADITAGKVGYEFDRPADGVKLTVTATIVDAAGNVSAEGSDSAVMGDTTATGAPTVVITEDANNDGTIDRTEINGKVNVEVGLPAEAKAGDTLKVSGQADRVLSDADINAGKVAYEFDRPADGAGLTVTATLVDAAGNVSAEGSDSAVMGDTTATGAPTVVITEDTNNDGTISNSEISGPVNVEVGLPAEAKAGDTLKVSGQADRVLSDADITAGKVAYEFDRPADGAGLTVTATIVDGAGNVSAEGKDSAVMGDTTATGAPTVVITEDANNDGTIDRTEISGKVDVNVGLPAEAKVGDTLKVSGQADRVLTDADITAGKVVYEFDRPADGVTLTVTATIVDGAGNESLPGSDSATMGDTTATGAPTVVITEDANNDGTISNNEINGAINVEVGLPAEAKAGNTLKVSGQADRVLSDADISAGKVAYEFDRPADGVKLTVTASIVDAAGNVSAEGSDSAVMGDTTATGAPTVVITEDANNDGTIDRTEISGKVNVEVGLPAEAKAGDTLKVSGQADRVLSDADISAGKVGYEFDRPADGQKITVTATLVDGAGNESLPGSDSATMGDTTATGAPTVTITEDANNDGTISNTEIRGPVNVEVGLPAEAKAGDTLKVSGQADRVLSDADISAGKVAYEFDRPADGQKITVTATLVDGAGNVSLPGSDSATMGDTTATGAPTVVITEDGNNDGTISNTEISGKVNVEVGLPADAKAGNTLKVSGQADRVLTDADITAGKVAYEFDRPADGAGLTVTASIVDAAGNVSAEGSDSAVMGDTTATGAPTVTITEDTDNDGTISNSEINGAINVEVSLPAEAKAGDTLKVSGQADRVLSDTDITAGKVGYEFDRPADGVTLTVTATIVDAAGNVSAEGRDSAVMGDTTATGAPTVTITEDANNDGTIDRTEISGKVDVNVGLPAEAKVGDTLKVSGQADRVLTDADITAGKVVYEFDRPADGVTLTVTATIVDGAGNESLPGSDSATMGDTTATGAPTVVITEDANNDGTISNNEINGAINVEVGLPAEAKAGNTLKMSGQADRVLSDADISAGKVAYEFDRPADGVKLTVTASIVDAAGNVSAEGSDSAVMGDTTATGAPTVVITEDANNDGTIDRTEISGKVNVEVGLPAEAKAGDTLKVSGQADRVLSDADISAGKVAYEFDRPADGVKLTVTATIVDAAGNESLPGSDSATMGDTTATGAPTVVITEDANNDGTISNTEISGKVNVEVGLPADAKAGDTLKVSGQADRVLTDADISAGKVGYEFDRPADGAGLTVTATLVDGAGNESLPGSDSAVMGDTTATGAPTVTITEDGNNDGTIDRTEISGKVDVNVGLPADAKAGDTLKVSGQADRVLSDADISAGKVAYEFDRPADGAGLTVTATIVDGAGNVSAEGSDSATMGDTTATGAPTVVITEDTNNDGTISNSEINGAINVEVSLPAEAKAGDTLKVSGQADRVLSDADISAGKVGYEFDRPADGQKITVTATLVDGAGNESLPGSDSATMGDTTATGAPTVTITEDANNDGTISNTEIRGPVNVEVGLPAEAKAGDTLKVSGQADRVLSDADISAGKVAYEFDRPADSQKITVTATIVDGAGNVSLPGSDSATMGDTTATGAPTVVITEDGNNDGTISNTEISGKVNVEVGLPADAKAGDTLKVSGQADRVLSDADISAGKVAYEFDRPADGAGLTVTATLVDGAGNVSAEGKDSAVMGDTTATGAPTVVITEDTDNDGTIDRTEINGQVNVEVGLPAEAKAGDTLKVSGQADRVLSDADISAGKVGYEFDRPADGVKLIVTASIVDAAGNVSAEGSDSAVMGDTTATGAPTVVITEDGNNDGTISNSEISGKVNVEVGLPAEAKAGDTLKVSGQADRVLSDTDITAGKVGYEFDRPADGVKLTVTATIVDGAGNVSAEGKDSAVMGDTTATGAPTVVITEDANNDGTIDRTEISGKVNVEVGLPAEAKAGDTLKVSGQADRVLTDTDISAGKVGYEFDRPADGVKLIVTASIVDAAGNVSAEGKDSATMGDTTATGAPTVVITEDGNNDGTISNSEISGPVNVEVGLPAEAKAGDTLKVSGQADRVLTDTDISAGKVGYEFDRPADGVKLIVTASIVDAAGNVSAEGKDSATMGDTTATGAPTVVITEDGNNDGTISNSEISGPVNVEVGLPAEAKAGDTLKVSGQADRVLTDTDISAGKVGYEFDRPADGVKLIVTASIVDAAGNVSAEGKDSATMGDTTATGAPTVVITEDGNNDGTISNSEISGPVNVEVGLPAEAKAGDTLKVSGQADRVLTDTDISAGKVGYEFDRPADGVKLIVTASIVDAAGNVSAEGSDSAVMGDTTATGAPTVVITEDTNNDGTISNSEISGPVNVEVGLPAEAKAGDTLKVSGQADRVLSDTDITAGKVGYEFDRPADGVKLTVTATIVDGAGNVSAEGKDSAVMGDTTATGAPTVVITEDANNDGTIDRTEISGKVDVNVGLPTDAKAGDTLKVSGQVDRVLSDADITAGKVAYEFDRPADGVKLTVTATIVDGAGNESLPGSDSATMGDTTATGAPTVTITEDTDNDGTISNTEISGKVDVNVSLPTDAKAGDTLKVSGQADRVLSDTDITAGKVGYEFDRPADGQKITVTATIVDGAGNESLPGSDSATMGDTTATGAPTVVIVDDVNNDQKLTKTEIGNDQIQVRAGVNHADLVAGGKVTLIINNGVVSSTVELTLKADGTLQSNNGKSYGYQNGVVSWTEATPGNGTSLTVTATQTDKAGNTSLPGSDTALVLAVPVTSGGYASGAEDTPLSLKWSDFKASDADTPDAQLSIKITSLPADGLLQYKDADGKWQTVTQALVNSGLTFSKGDIDAGKLQFLPDLHESSSAAGNNGGTPGNKLGDYAAFDYQVSDGVNASDNAKFVIDIKPVVDGVTLKVELVSGGLTPGAAKVEEILDSLQGKNPSSNPTGGNDYLVSSNGSWVDGGAGNDTIKFGSGTSFQAIGGAGNDTLIGGASVNEVLIGGDGDDILIGGKNATSSVKLQGDGGNDTLISQSLKATTSYYGGDGQDVAYMPGSMKALKLVTTGLPNSCDYRLVYTDPVTGAVTNHDFYSVETLYLQDGKYEFEGGQLSKVADLATLKIDADLIDTDGSERFTELTIKGLPQGAEVSGGTLQADGSWKVPASMLDQDGKLSLQIELPVGSQNIKVTVVAGSQEYDMNGQPISGEVKFTEADAGFMIKPANPNGDNTLDGGGGDDVLLGDIGGIKTSVEPGKNYNVALIVDTSGSMAYGLDGNKEPSRGQDRMTLTINALKVLANQLASHDGVVNVTLIGFAGSASNMLKIEDLNSANLQTLINKITALSADGGTNYEDAFIKATEWFNTKPGSGTDLKFENLTYFLTDGDPTTYNGDKSSSGGTTNDADMQKAIDVFTSLSGLSEVKAIGIGTGVTEGNLKYFDNTQVTGASSQYGQSQILNDFSSNSGVWRASSWGKTGDSSGTVVRDNDKIELTDKASSGASIFTSATLAVAAGNGIRFDLSTDSDFSSGDSFSVQLQRWNGSSWVNVGSALNTTGMIDSGPLVAADYRYVFTLNDIDDGWSWSRGWDNTSATLVIDNLAKVTDYPPIGQPDIITKAEDLQAVLVGGSVTNTPAEVGSDTVNGGAGSDILFGDAINTDYLPWGAAGNPAKPTDWVNGKGLDGLTQFLTLKNGYAPSTVELYEYIKGNAKSFDVAGDTRGGHDKLYGGLGDDILFGQGGNDELSGDAGNDALYGGTGNDTLSGGLGNDILTGGLGNDILKGDAGSDAFTWLKGDTVAGSVAKDYVLDFSKSEGDKLDLSDLLDSDGSKNQSSLKGLLSVFQDSEGVHLQVKESSAAPVTQEIVLMNHSFDTLTGNAGATSTQVIDFMLNNHMLEIDK